MDGRTETVNGPLTPFKAIKESSRTPSIPCETQTQPVSGLFASPTFDTKMASRAEKEPACAAGAPVRESITNAEKPATLVEIQFATPSPFPVRAKRPRSTGSVASDAQFASNDRHGLSNSEAQRPEGFSPIACFPSLEPAGAPRNDDTAAPKAQRDLFANGPCSRAGHPAPKHAGTAYGEQKSRPRKVVAFGELVAEGLRQKLQPRPPADTTCSDDDVGPTEPVAAAAQMEGPTRLVLSSKDEQWLEKMVAHYNSKTR